MSAARSQELIVGMGFKKQSALQTSLAAPSLWNLLIDRLSLPIPRFNRETNAGFFGKGHPFATQVFPTSKDASYEFSSFLTSQNWAQAITFGAGSYTEDSPASGVYRYIATPILQGDDSELPAITIVGGLRQGLAGEIVDTALIGMVVSGFTLRVQRGPGLQNTNLTIRWVGCGKSNDDSGLTIPTAYSEVRLGAGFITSLLINGTNYITDNRFIDLEFNWENDVKLEGGYYPGSGQQDGYDLRGRMRVGNQSSSLVWSVEADTGADELADFSAGVEGTTVILIEGPVIAGGFKHTAKIEYPRMIHQALEPIDADGYAAFRITTEPLMHVSDGVCILTGITDKAGIGSAE